MTAVLNGYRIRRRLAALSFCLLFLFISAETAFPAEELAKREALESGLVLLHSQKQALPIVKVVLAIKAGSIFEPAQKAGLANLTADLLNEGTMRRTSKEISEAIDFVGGSISASGGPEYMTISLSVLKKDVKLGFDLLSDMVLNPAFREDEIKRRKAVIKSSIIQQKEDPGTVASKAFLPAIYGDHPYGRPPEGTEETVEGLTRQDVVEFHRTYYAPNNAIIAVAGDLDRKEVISLIDTYFKDWSRRDVPETKFPELPALKGRKVIKIKRDVTQASIILGHLGIRREDPDYYAVSVMNYILGGGGFASRLMDNIRDNRGLSYDVHSVFSAGRHAGSFLAGLQTKNASANLAIDEIIREMGLIRTSEVADKELSDAKAYLTGSFPLRIDSTGKIASFLVAVEYFGLGMDYAERYKTYIESVTRDDILRVARRYLNTEDFVLVIVGDLEKAGLKY